MSTNHFMSMQSITKNKYKKVCTTRESAATGLKCNYWRQDGVYHSKDCQNCHYSIYKNGDLIVKKQEKFPVFCSHPANKNK